MHSPRKGYNLSELSHLKAGEDKEVSSDENSAAKFFFFGVRRKEKTPNQYAIITVYANESLTKKTMKIKGTK